MRSHPGGPDAAGIEETITVSERVVYRQHVTALLARGYLPSLELAETAYTLLEIRRLREGLERDRTRALHQAACRDRVRACAAPDADPTTRAEAEAELHASLTAGDAREPSPQTYRALGDLQATFRAQILLLDKRHTTQLAHDPEREFRLAEQWVQAHLGEFEAICPSPTCGQILSLPALPHWAFAPVATAEGPVPMVWSGELWQLVVDGTLALWVMAYVLRTSPEGLYQTAKRRGEAWPVTIDLGVEERLLELRLRTQDRQALALPS